ncbi:MAG: DUF1571 domain-containing protein [Myxococcota bacterium]
MLLCVATMAAGAGRVDAEGVRLWRRLLDEWDAVQTMSYRLRKAERLCHGELVREEVFIKLRKPDSFYIAGIAPRRGQEVIYVGSRDRNHLTVHPGHFPDFTLSLDIRGSLVTRRQHHIVAHSGLQYTLDGLRESLMAVRRGATHGELRYGGKTTLFGRPAQIVVMAAGDDDLVPLRAREDETLIAFGERIGQDPHVILCANPSVDSLTDELEARDYSVPVHYASKTELVLDDATGLPLRVTMWDAKANLYERYEYLEVKINPPLTDIDFNPDNPAYDF